MRNRQLLEGKNRRDGLASADAWGVRIVCGGGGLARSEAKHKSGRPALASPNGLPDHNTLTPTAHCSGRECRKLRATMAASDRIVKLVFLRCSERKCVVPLVEGCDFDMFIGRVRRRLGLQDATPVTLHDAATGAVDSIDRLLEVDEGNTLEVSVPPGTMPSASAPAQPLPTGAAAASSSSSMGAGSSSSGSGPNSVGRATHRASVFSPKASSAPLYADGGQQPECRLAIPTSPGFGEDDGEEESGAGKYRKRQRFSLARSRRGVLGLLLLLGLGFAAYTACS